MASIPSGSCGISPSDQGRRGGKRGLHGLSKESMAMRNTQDMKPCSGDCCSQRKVEVLTSIRLPKGKRINIDRTLDSILDAFAVEGSVEHVDAVFIRVYRGKAPRGK